MKQVATSLLQSAQTIAAAGSTQADATPITTAPQGFVHVTGADGTKGVILPPATKGKLFIIKNSDAANAILKVYPHGTGDTINALGATNPISMAEKSSAIFVVGVTGIAWFTIPTVPS
jgi:hypothetical protein